MVTSAIFGMAPKWPLGNSMPRWWSLGSRLGLGAASGARLSARVSNAAHSGLCNRRPPSLGEWRCPNDIIGKRVDLAYLCRKDEKREPPIGGSLFSCAAKSAPRSNALCVLQITYNYMKRRRWILLVVLSVPKSKPFISF